MSFLDAYITAALWSSTAENGDPLDDSYGPDDIAPDTLARMTADCEAFQAANDTPDYPSKRGDFSDDDLAGHDFWLTRNGHGVGFWDRGLPDDIGKRLTDAAHAFGSFDLYVGDDGLIHGEG